MHQLHRVPICQRGVIQLQPPYNLAIQLDHHRAGVESEMPQQVGRRGGSRKMPGFPVHQDLELAQEFSTQGASMERVAAAGSSACQSARIAATP